MSRVSVVHVMLLMDTSSLVGSLCGLSCVRLRLGNDWHGAFARLVCPCSSDIGRHYSREAVV